MSRFLRKKNGEFAGSIGAGKNKVPTAAAPVQPSVEKTPAQVEFDEMQARLREAAVREERSWHTSVRRDVVSRNPLVSTATNQETVDSLIARLEEEGPSTSTGRTHLYYIDSDTPVDFDASRIPMNATIVIRGTTVAHVRGGGHIVAADEAPVYAHGNSHVFADGSATVYASETAHVEAYGNSHVKGADNSEVEAYDKAAVEVRGHATAHIYDHVKASAHSGTHVDMHDDARLHAYGDADISLHGGDASLHQHTTAHILSVEATVEAFDLSSVKIRDGKEDQVHKRGPAVVVEIYPPDPSE